jgi:hypothetical protein
MELADVMVHVEMDRVSRAEVTPARCSSGCHQRSASAVSPEKTIISLNIYTFLGT